MNVGRASEGFRQTLQGTSNEAMANLEGGGRGLLAKQVSRQKPFVST